MTTDETILTLAAFALVLSLWLAYDRHINTDRIHLLLEKVRAYRVAALKSHLLRKNHKRCPYYTDPRIIERQADGRDSDTEPPAPVSQ